MEIVVYSPADKPGLGFIERMRTAYERTFRSLLSTIHRLPVRHAILCELEDLARLWERRRARERRYVRARSFSGLIFPPMHLWWPTPSPVIKSANKK